ncbi:MAG TPA: Rv3235 family protein [Amycolatopsis sp.]|uniref:Rv3235 family protein n=1 Tax=Amycolatopsis sp. TaxID=37632 RepID=UPI002B46F327|nr:Rv3235 family protein [Amycolatopsis sp.]HKS44766.1 Rv3235 family protein [Amycolatopsis sp.]
MPHTAGALHRLRPYEPDRDRSALLDPGTPLALDLPPGPQASANRPGPPPDVRQLRAVLNLILEVRAGHRPAHQLRTAVHPRLYRLLSEETPTAKVRYTLKTVHGCRVAPHAVEACGTAHSQGRAYALVARFEQTSQGWRCTFFHLIRPRAKPRA